jgi:hypothetical protein
MSIVKTRVEAVIWVKQILDRSRGNELVGVFNPQLIGKLFREQTENWGAISKPHINRIARIYTDFILPVLENVTIDNSANICMPA